MDNRASVFLICSSWAERTVTLEGGVVMLSERRSLAAAVYHGRIGELLLFNVALLNLHCFALESGTEFDNTTEARLLEFQLSASSKARLREMFHDHAYEHLLAEILLCQAVQEFEKYLKNVLIWVNTQYPGTADKRARVSIDDVSRFATVEELGNQLVLERIEEVSRRGLQYLLQEFERIGVTFKLGKEDRRKIFKAFKIRNDIVHENLVASKALGMQLGGYAAEVNKLFGGDMRMVEFFYDIVNTFDTSVLEKYDIAWQPEK